MVVEQTTTALSSAEAELYSMSKCAQQTASLLIIARDFGSERCYSRFGDRSQARAWRQNQPRQGAVLVDPGRSGKQGAQDREGRDVNENRGRAD